MSEKLVKKSISPSAETRNLKDISDKTGNLYQSLVVISKRAKQINGSLKEELNAKLNEFAATTDNLEEVFENREQIEISKHYEKMPRPSLQAFAQFMDDELYYRKRTAEEKAEAEAKAKERKNRRKR